MAELQQSVVTDQDTRHQIQTQILQWEENLERLHCEQFRLRCYMASLQGGELPNPKVCWIFDAFFSPTYCYIFETEEASAAARNLFLMLPLFRVFCDANFLTNWKSVVTDWGRILTVEIAHKFCCVNSAQSSCDLQWNQHQNSEPNRSSNSQWNKLVFRENLYLFIWIDEFTFCNIFYWIYMKSYEIENGHKFTNG